MWRTRITGSSSDGSRPTQATARSSARAHWDRSVVLPYPAPARMATRGASDAINRPTRAERGSTSLRSSGGRSRWGTTPHGSACGDSDDLSNMRFLRPCVDMGPVPAGSVCGPFPGDRSGSAWFTPSG